MLKRKLNNTNTFIICLVTLTHSVSQSQKAPTKRQSQSEMEVRSHLLASCLQIYSTRINTAEDIRAQQLLSRYEMHSSILNETFIIADMFSKTVVIQVTAQN